MLEEETLRNLKIYGERMHAGGLVWSTPPLPRLVHFIQRDVR